MTDEENGSSVKFAPEVKEEAIPPASIEEGVPQDVNGGLKNRGESTRLSAVSKKYDIDGDGKLDETEQAMRAMDKENRGYLTNDKVYKIMQDQIKTQKDLLNARRLIIFFLVFTVILALATLGTSFAAARLAQNTETSNNVLVVKGTDETVATDTHADTFSVTTTVQDQRTRRAQAETSGSTTTIKKNKMDQLYRECSKGISVLMERTWTGYSLVHEYSICGSGGSFSRNDVDGIDTYTLTNGKVITIGSCTGNSGNSDCIVSGDGLELAIGDQCVESTDCEHNNCYTGFANSDIGKCRCNPYSADSGCSSPYQCFSGSDIDSARGLSEHHPACLLDVGVASSSASDCVTNMLESGSCACNPNTGYGCETGRE